MNQVPKVLELPIEAWINPPDKTKESESIPATTENDAITGAVCSIIQIILETAI